MCGLRNRNVFLNLVLNAFTTGVSDSVWGGGSAVNHVHQLTGDSARAGYYVPAVSPCGGIKVRKQKCGATGHVRPSLRSD